MLMHCRPSCRAATTDFNAFEGIYAHGNIDRNRSDGIVLTLYCWLRLFNGLSDTDAYPITKSLVADASLVKTNVPYLTRKVVAVDVTGKVPGRGIPI